jgi:hypothetical protein
MLKNKTNLAIVGCAVLFAVLGCSTMMKGKEAADAGVAKFHQQFNDSQFSQIYSESSDKLKAVSSEKDLYELLSAVHRKLGTVKSTSMSGFNVNTNFAGTFVNANYSTEFTDGKANEQFVFQIDGDNAILVSYFVNSNDLITK